LLPQPSHQSHASRIIRAKLTDLKRQVDAAIDAKVTERLHEIESELSKLYRLDGGRGAKIVRAETRGVAALKVGKKPNEPPAMNGPKSSTPKTKTRKTRKARNNAKTGLSTVVPAQDSEHPPIASLPVEPITIEPPPVASIAANVMPTDVSAAA
jgi:hypothetical protein